MKIGVLTSSRADFGIYLPLLLKLKIDKLFDLEIIAFGMHLSKLHGFTVTEIKKEGFKKIHEISSLISNDDEQAISTSYALTTFKFAEFWSFNKFDIVFCIGDRFEMSAAVQAGIPFGIKFAHFHGGETTLGAIDNVYRHQITIASTLHFTAANQFSFKIAQLTEKKSSIHNVGSLSLNDIESFKPINKELFLSHYKIPDENFVLITFHPETNAFKLNKLYAIEMRKSLEYLTSKLFLVITMPNADTMGSIYREEFNKLKSLKPKRVLCIESFGKSNYFNAIYYSKLLVGNTSSGILEAASFRKFVVNVGKRQEGRLQSGNILNAEFNKESIIKNIEKALSLKSFKGKNVYYQKDPSSKVLSILKKYYATI
jgi:GDP/UDP-N,N'-diacetylbacillosamine 2-epimerase (hydrolysing)